MYDNIKIIQYTENISDLDKQVVKERFSMYNENLKTGAYNNSGYQKLIQNRGVFISFVPLSGNINAHYIIQFSAHKFWNCWKIRALQNYNTFTISDLLETYEEFKQFIPFTLDGAKVQAFEAGANIEMSKNPSDYMRQLSHIQIGKREIRIIENPKYKEFKNYTSHFSTNKRAVYSFYDKTEESKPFAPANLLRVEKKYIRMAENPLLSEIFDIEYIKAIKKDLETSFVKNLNYKKNVVQEKGVNDNEIRLYNLIEKHAENAENELLRMKNNAEITRLKYYRLIEKMKQIREKKDKYILIEHRETHEMRENIEKTLKML